MTDEQANAASRLAGIESRLDNLDRTFHRTLLVSVSLLNIALFIGGTVYTGVQVDSIQKRYAEASTKISEARQKYDEADAKLKSIQTILSDTEQQSNKVLADVRKNWKDNADEIAKIRKESGQQLEVLKTNSAATLASMNDYKRATEVTLEKAARDVAVKLEREIQFNRSAIEKKQADIDALGLQIAGLSSRVEAKSLELGKIQNGLEDQLGIAKKLNTEFTQKIKGIAGVDKITVPVAYRISDIWLKALVGGLFFICLVLSLLALLMLNTRR